MFLFENNNTPAAAGEIVQRCALIIAGRGISADSVAHASLRVMPPVMNIGEAAGTAAALALPGGDVRRVNVAEVQRIIRANGGAIEPIPE